MAGNSLSKECLERLTKSGVTTVALAAECDRVTDIAVALGPARLAVLRCVEHSSSDDRAAIATMMSQRDFVWGAVLHREGGGADPLGLVESFHVDELDHLVSRLLELREALA